MWEEKVKVNLLENNVTSYENVPFNENVCEGNFCKVGLEEKYPGQVANLENDKIGRCSLYQSALYNKLGGNKEGNSFSDNVGDDYERKYMKYKVKYMANK
jgi:hypothetical protein